MSWAVRYEGSPHAVEGLTLEQVTAGLQDGQWEGTDEVKGPQDADWQAFESHPLFAEAVTELEPPPRVVEDETRLDMTPLIDVTLVLLIFFILTTSYAAIERMLESAGLTGSKPAGAVSAEEVAHTMIRVEVRMQDGRPVIYMQSGDVLKKDVPADKLEETLLSLPREGKTALLIDHDDQVKHGLIVRIQDAAKQAKIDQVYFKAP